MIFTELKWCQISQSGFAEAILFLVVALHYGHHLLHALAAGSEEGGLDLWKDKWNWIKG